MPNPEHDIWMQLPGTTAEGNRSSRAIVAACCSTTFAVGVAALYGWYTGNQFLMTVLPGHISMKANTAICFLLASAGLMASLYPHAVARNLSRAAGVLTLVVAGLTLIEYVSRTDLRLGPLGLDELFFLDIVQYPFPGRMAQITAVEFCLAGVAVLLLTAGKRARQWAQGVALLMTVIAFAAIVGFFYGVPLLFGATSIYTSMAFHTGVCFLILGAGFLFAPCDSVLNRLLWAPERGSYLARRLLPALLFFPALLGWVYLQPLISFGWPAFGMGLFAVTMTVGGMLTLTAAALFLNRNERRLADLAQAHAMSAAAVLESERELRLITDYLPTLISYIDADGRFLRVNRTYELWLGLPAASIVGRSVRDLLGERYWQATEPARQAMQGGKSITFDVLYPTVHGNKQSQVTYTPDIDEEGRVKGIACMVVDVHARHQAETALRQSEKLAAVGRLASSIAHEINNPLEAVTNLLYLAAHESSSAAESAQFLKDAQTELGRVTEIVTQTLRFHRHSAKPGHCNLSELAEQVLGLYQGRIHQKGITVDRQFHDVDVLCRDGEIRQVLANLVGNAVDAMSGPGRLVLRTRAMTTVDGRKGASVVIADTGAGIPAEIRQTLFEPFFTTKGSTGSGLGLWISKEIVIGHGGSIRVRSRVASGTEGGAPGGTVFRLVLFDLAKEITDVTLPIA